MYHRKAVFVARSQEMAIRTRETIFFRPCRYWSNNETRTRISIAANMGINADFFMVCGSSRHVLSQNFECRTIQILTYILMPTHITEIYTLKSRKDGVNAFVSL
jgi:hypothetical protein